jgi:hypothetical protein
MNRRDENGFALLGVLLLMCVMAGMVGVVQLGDLTLSRDTLVERGKIQALYGAEGGLAKARHALHSDPLWSGGEWRIGASEVRVEVHRRDGSGREVTARAVAWPSGRHGQPVQVTLREELGDRYRYHIDR